MDILIVDDEKKICSSLRVLLDQQPGWQVVGETSNSQGAIEQNRVLKPDIVLLDWGVPKLPSDELIQQLKQSDIPPIIIVFSGRIEMKQNALQAGANLFVSKSDPPQILLEAISKASVIKKSNPGLLKKKYPGR